VELNMPPHTLQLAIFLPAMVLFALAGLYSMRHPTLKYYAFTIWVFAFVSASLAFPQAFTKWGGFELKNTIVPLIQIIMFGMGTTLSVADFSRILKTPWAVLIGFVAQFLIMPLLGFTLAHSFNFPPEIAAGVVLIGCCPSGVASNVMSYLARGDVALSVTITSCTTLASPILTPLLMQSLGGRWVNTEFTKMMLEIINMIIVPIIAGLIANHVLYSRQATFRRRPVLVLLTAGVFLLAVLVAVFAPSAIVKLDLGRTLGSGSLSKVGVVIGLFLIGIVALAKLVINLWLGGPENWMDRALPIVSMVAICCIIAVITAQSTRDLLTVGPLLFVCTLIHNGAGYLLGYWMARAARLPESSCRAVAFEVGMQNGGMASALAIKFPTLVPGTISPAALAPAIFGPWQNVSGSILATWWHRRPAEPAAVEAVAQEA
jgi:bile acid:Na+ symporter, BASS family